MTRWRLPTLCAGLLIATAPAAGQVPDSTEVDWSGYVQLFGFAPVDGEGRVELYTLGIGVDVATTGIAEQRFGFHGLVRIRDTELRDFYDTTVWAQEAYGWWDAPGGRVKVGKVYALGGRFWDGSFFGNVHYFDGLKLDPGFGLSYEGAREGNRWEVGYAVQWLPDGDGLNGALPGRDPETFDDIDEREQVRLRLAPAWRPRSGYEAGIGVSWARKELEDGGFVDSEVRDAALDARLAWPWGEAYAELLSRDADGSARAVDPELEADYLLAGTRLHWRSLAAYYNHSRVDYDSGVQEWIHQPGLAWSPAERFVLLWEYDHWTREEADGSRSLLDRSHNIVVEVFF